MDSSYINCKNQKVKWCREENVCYLWFWILLNSWVLLATRMDLWTELNTLTWTVLLPGFSLIICAVLSLSDHWPHKLMWAALVSAMWFSEQSFLDSTTSYAFFIYIYVVLQESKNFLMICTKYYFLSWSLGWHILMDLREAICGRRSNPMSKERWLHRHRRAERSYSTFKVRKGSHEEIPLVQGKRNPSKTVAHQAPLYSTISYSLLKFMSIEWMMLTISSSATLFSWLQSSPGYFLLSWLFSSGGQNIGALASAPFLPTKIQGCFPLGLTWFDLLPHISSVQFSHSVVSNSLWPHESQHTRPPCPSPTPGVHPNPCPLSRWCHPTISFSVVPFSYCPQSFPASGYFQMSQLFTSRGQSSGVSVSTSFLPINTQDWSPLEWTGWISLQSKGL